MKIIKDKKLIVSFSHKDWEKIGMENNWIKKSNVIDLGVDRTNVLFGENIPYASSYEGLEIGIKDGLSKLKSFYIKFMSETSSNSSDEKFMFYFENSLWNDFLEFVRKEYNLFLNRLKKNNDEAVLDGRFTIIERDGVPTIGFNSKYLSICFHKLKSIYIDYSENEVVPHGIDVNSLF